MYGQDFRGCKKAQGRTVMAFTGTATIKRVSDKKYRITGLSLGNAAAGTIALSSYTGSADVEIDGTEQWDRYVTSGLNGGVVSLADSIEARFNLADAASALTEDIAVSKAGDGPKDFVMTFTNLGAQATGALEIYVEFH